ncbi:MAG: hypothetical protein IJH63_11065 [Methanobrevibacter sp.]|nr:hypothetical protein [Methanobrevibacter sp.]
MTIGNIEANTIEINSRVGNSHRLLHESVRHIIKNRGIHIIGGFVKAEIVFANLNLEFISIV